ncbi:MAG: aminoacyl-tRNA hydrolase [Syntrophobacterales bacterium]|nr:aminoacyl-tRNA hydrolase [Syntrophobacterales bacterium]
MINLLVGLGNPGSRYVFTRHNVGFMVIDLIWEKANPILEEKKTPWGVLKRVHWNDLLLITLKPLTYMNNSGEAVSKALMKEGLKPSEMVIIHDDLDLPLGRIKIARGGSSGGHRGVQSIIDTLGTKDFPRIKIGIGRPLRGEEIMEYVLAPPYPEERDLLRLVLDHAVKAVEVVCRDGIEKGMNMFNGVLIRGH